MNANVTIEPYTIEEMEQVAAGWAKLADDFRIDGDSQGVRNMGAVRYAQDVAVKWARRAQAAQRVQQGII
jgi:hypothetical protein